jgi:hypothetical protein
MFKKAILGSMSIVAGCALMAFVVTVAICGVVGGLMSSDDDAADRADTDKRPDARPT